MSHEQDNRSRRDEADKMSPELASALRVLGLGMPRTIEEVAAAEKELEREGVSLPPSLLNADAVLDRRPGSVLPLRPRRYEGDQVARENLARAAREGGTIPPEVDERMRKDREQAERERDGR